MTRSDRAQRGLIVDVGLENYILSDVSFSFNFSTKARDTDRHSVLGKKYT
jgi:hypothetical protein